MYGRLVVLTLAASFMFALIPDGKAVECPSLPLVAWWGSNKHSEVVATVNQKNGGDWDGYISKWQGYLSKMQGVLSKGGVVEVQKFGVKMKGASLAGYVRKIGSRIAVLRCLQSQVSLGTTVKSVSLTGSERAAKITADQTEYITGQVAYEKGDYGTALRNWMPLADKGDPVAQYHLGNLFAKGQGVLKDNIKAVAWFAKSAAQGNDQGQKSLGDMYRKGKGVPKDAKKAVKWYRDAALQGNALAKKNLGDMYRKGRGVIRDYAEALKWYRGFRRTGRSLGPTQRWPHVREGVGGHPQGLCGGREVAPQGGPARQRQGDLQAWPDVRKGHGITRDAKLALEWYRKAAKLELPAAQKALARLEKTKN